MIWWLDSKLNKCESMFLYNVYICHWIWLASKNWVLRVLLDPMWNSRGEFRGGLCALGACRQLLKLEGVQTWGVEVLGSREWISQGVGVDLLRIGGCQGWSMLFWDHSIGCWNWREFRPEELKFWAVGSGFLRGNYN